MERETMPETVIAFGVFDGLHKGHEHFLSEAAKLGKRLVIVLTLPETALRLKGRLPDASYEERKKALLDFLPRAEVVPSDREPGDWSVLRRAERFIVALGYDQDGMAAELERMKVPFEFVGPHHPETYKSSILRAKR